ncbi:integrase [Caudoviricetes sp.]|nr:integrase [Caudoviricetes sp.]
MGRHREGWKLRRKVPGGVWYVRFTAGGRTVERSTGTSVRAEAEMEARRIYADELQREQQQPSAQRRGLGRRAAAAPIEDELAEWLRWLDSTLAKDTVETYLMYGRAHFAPFFKSVSGITEESAAAYIRHRLQLVMAVTVRKEVVALRSFVAFMHKAGRMPELKLPGVPKRVAGTPHTKRRRVAASELDPDEVELFLAALPEWSESDKVEPFPIRARFIVGYETGLRPSTLTRIATPEHYRAGMAVLRLTAAVDKARWARDVPLTERAREALDGVLARLDAAAKKATGKPYAGPIFGRHSYVKRVRAAAEEAFAPEVAERFAAAHLRSAFTTHELEQGKNIVGIQFRVGHKLLSTTSRYVKPSFRAALETIIPGAPKKKRTRNG